MRVLLLASEAVDADVVRRAVGSEADEAEVLVVAPAYQRDGLRFWMSDVDGAIERARGVADETAASLSSEGIEARGDTGEADPLVAVQDALATFPADRIVAVLHGDADDHLHLEDESRVREASERFGVPVETVRV